MIRRFAAEGGRLRQVEGGPAADEKVIWYDLLAPSHDEEKELEVALGVNIPTREDMEEIEVSSRLYYEDDAAFMTATLPSGVDANVPQIAPVTFVLAAGRLITVRYHEPQAFCTFPQRAEKVTLPEASAAAVLAALLDAIVDRLADILERVGRDIELISQDIFQHPDDARASGRDFQKILGQIGRQGDLSSNVRDSLVTLERMFGFLTQYALQRTISRHVRARIKTLTRDAQSLMDHASYLSQKITFLLDATLGMVNIEQNATIKIFSVAAVVFLPPTLIASIYGMNFDHMPELGWLFGYPFAVGLMLASAILPYLYFKRRGWL
jgi:magnesium transporter